VRQLDEVVFAMRSTGRVYLKLRGGRVDWIDDQTLQAAIQDDSIRAALNAVAPTAIGRTPPSPMTPAYVADLLPQDRIRTLGDWGDGDETDRART
jgi:hypothetical protein